MKKLIVSMSAAFCGIVAVSAASIENVIIRQQWPWSAKVNVDYTLNDATGGRHDVKVTFRSDGKEIVPAYGSLTGDRFNVAAGVHRIVWDPQYGGNQGYDKLYPNMTATVALEDSDNLYMVVDLSGGKDAASYPVSFTSVPPSGGWNQLDYKHGDKLVLRRIPAGTFEMGLTQAEIDHYGFAERSYAKDVFQRRKVTLTKPYYIGIFPVTKGQYNKMEGVAITPDWEAMNPVRSGVTYSNLRGSATWPQLADDSILGRLNAKTAAAVSAAFPGYRFELPTQAQWEMACRAGTTTTFSNGKNWSEGSTNLKEPNLDPIAWYADGSQFPLVGQKQANAFDLYDMHGLVHEFIRDLLSNAAGVPSGVTNPQTDPLLHVTLYPATWGCGGRYNGVVAECVAGYEMLVGNEGSNYNVGEGIGFRLAFVGN